MSALGDALVDKNRVFLLNCKATIAIDSIGTAVIPTYSVLLEAPAFSETLLSAQTPEAAIAAITELTEFVSGKW